MQQYVTFDDSPTVITEAVPIPKTRGRPKGSRARTVVGHDQSFSTADFAFMRAHLLGTDVRSAASRYLFHLNITSTKEASSYFEALMERMSSLLAPSAKLNEEASSYLSESIDCILQWRADVEAFKSPAVTPAPVKDALPTLDEFQALSGMDDFTQDEVLEAYKERYADQLRTETATVVEQQPIIDPFSNRRISKVVDAISSLQGMISISPSGSDTVKSWLAPSLAERFLPFGVITLSDLVNWINITGRGWYSRIEAIGKAKAVRLLQWLVDNEKTVGVELNEIVRALLPASPMPFMLQETTDLPTTTNTAEMATWETVSFGIVPIEQLDWPRHLLGFQGAFRSHNNNTLGATNDSEAVRFWLKRYADKPRTFDAYRRAVECLVLWAVVENGKQISSLTELDLHAFRAFLKSPPAHWVQTFRVTKGSKHWRPLRGSMSDSSVDQTMRAISAMYSKLHDANYLTANPAKGMVKSTRTELKLDTTRSLSNQDLEVVAATLQSMPESPRKRRIRALLLILQSTGLRKSELCSLRWSDLTRARVDNNESDVWQVTFAGKGNKERTVPITLHTYQALLAHREDRKALAQTRKLAYMRALPDGDWPLIGILDESAAQERPGKEGEFIYDSYRPANTTGQLSIQRMHMIIKDFFKLCSVKAVEMGRDATTFSKASMHWMRHTFAVQVLAATNNDLAVVQQLMGHSSISITGHYVKANMNQRIKAVQKLGFNY